MICPMCHGSHAIEACPRWRVPVILFAFLLTGCATIPGLEISDEERAACAASGCSVWTQAELEDLVRAAMIKGIEAARRQRGAYEFGG